MGCGMGKQTIPLARDGLGVYKPNSVIDSYLSVITIACDL